MKIFLSWSGERSRAAAQALRDWLPLVLHYAQPWFSDRDIGAGERWAVEIGKELEGTRFGLIVLTADNLEAPWILFEAGALSKAFTATAVIPYLIDVEFKDITGPLSQFQAKKSDRGATLDLIVSINAKSETPLDQQRLQELFEALWPKLEAKLHNLPVSKGEPRPRAQGQILEDLVAAVRRMEARIDRFSPPSVDRDSLVEEIPVTVDIEGEFPEIGPAQRIRYLPGSDLVEDIGLLAGVDPEQYGHEWFLLTGHSRKPITRVSARKLASMAHRRPIKVILTRGPLS